MEGTEVWEKLLRKRVVCLSSDIDAEMVGKIGSSIMTLNLESPDEIKMIIDSGGGKIVSSLKLVDFIKISKAPVTAIVIGACSSSAVNVLEACHKRLSMPHSRFFLHFASHNDFGYNAGQSESAIIGILRKEIRGTKMLQRALEDLILAQTNISRGELRRLMRDGGTRLNAQEALKIGLIDEIVEKYDLF